jgi:dTDP-4-dehydrorhamnose reductase
MPGIGIGDRISDLEASLVRMLVTGLQGQVSRALREIAATENVDLVQIGRPQVDLADPASIAPAVRATAPDVVVSAAAYTAVDKAEAEPELAERVNHFGAKAIAAAARQAKTPIIHLSTDYVFSGTKPEPYVEEDAPAPTNVYGRSKLAGELAVAAEAPDHAILRCAWIYSPFGQNFVKTMLRLASERPTVRVVADQRGNPTSALDIAAGIVTVARNLLASDDAGLRGVFHMSSAGETTWAGFAQALFQISARHGGPSAQVQPITTAEYPTAAGRPANSRLSCARLAQRHGVHLPLWLESMHPVVLRLLEERNQGP